VRHASADDVVDKALNYVFSKDRDFQKFLRTPEAKQDKSGVLIDLRGGGFIVASTLRVRKGPSQDEAEQPAKKLVAGVESMTSVRAVKA
jgi:hypothetical protein